MIGDHGTINDLADMTAADKKGQEVGTGTEASTEAREVITIDHVTMIEEETIAIAAVVHRHGSTEMISGIVGINRRLRNKRSLERIRHTALTTSGLRKK